MSSFDLLGAYQPHDTLAVGETGTRSMRQLLADIATIAAQLPQGDGTGLDQPDLLVTCQDRYYLCAVLLAAWQRGRVVALPPNGREQTLAELSARCSGVLNDGSGPGQNVVTWLQERGSVPGLSLANLEAYAPIPAEQRVVTIYTSGSTGTPNACPKTAAQLIGEGFTLQKTFQLTPDSCVLATVVRANVLDYAAVCIEDCVDTMDGPPLHEAALTCIRAAFGWVMVADEALRMFGRGESGVAQRRRA